MIFIKKNKQKPNKAGNRIFGLLNARILKFQNRLAGLLNSWINSYIRRGQQRIFWIFIVFSVCGISARLIISLNRTGFSKPANHYTLPKINLKPTNSLTTKK